ncbi:hypothetical protein EET67_07580 [Pseudaminobacter arsenicus]|uniref:Lipoprotein n=1 Tax=Borborobacter arsenicus TaxID=1851146 RepID=A0A432V8H0_9HYPH|nr:hypothetical protein [Pseudaminobacter arsenicus]RUM98482.1 hypothetical protein EET67_07580 [Pseudaminobacter arsenicus]
MSMKPLFRSAVIGLAGLSLSGCVYDGGPYYYDGPGYYGSGYYAGSAIIYDSYDRGRYYRHRHYNRYPGNGDHHRPPPPSQRPPQVRPPIPPIPPRTPVVINRGGGEHRGQQGQIFLPPEGGYRHN